MIYLSYPTMYVYCIHPAMSKRRKQIIQKRAETSVAQIVFQGVFFEVRVYTIPASYRLST